MTDSRFKRIDLGQWGMQGVYSPETAAAYKKWGPNGVLMIATSKGALLYVDLVGLANGSTKVIYDTGLGAAMANGASRDLSGWIIPRAQAKTGILSSSDWVKLSNENQMHFQNIPEFFEGARTDGFILASLREGIANLVNEGAAKWYDIVGGKTSTAECYMNGFEYAMTHLWYVVDHLAMQLGAKPSKSELFYKVFNDIEKVGWTMDFKALRFIFPWNRAYAKLANGRIAGANRTGKEMAAVFDCADLWTWSSSHDLAKYAAGKKPKEVWLKFPRGATCSIDIDRQGAWFRFPNEEKAEQFADEVAQDQGVWGLEYEEHLVYSRNVLI